jgi:hypothetical protein
VDPSFKERMPRKENGWFNLAVKEEKNLKEAVVLILNKKAMFQFIQAFPTMSLHYKINLQN